MIVVSDSSPLITLARIRRLELLRQLYQRIAITPEVYHEIVLAGGGLTGSVEVATSKWIQVMPVSDRTLLAAAQLKSGLGLGEISAIIGCS